MANQFESFAPGQAGHPRPSAGELHAEYVNATVGKSMGSQVEARASAPAERSLLPPIPVGSAAPMQEAIQQGKPIQFSSTGENQAANRQPDYYLTTEGLLQQNLNAPASPDGSINIEIQSAKPEDNKHLRDAITHETDMQKHAAQEMIRLFQQNHPGEEVPGWMNDLANAKPNLPDFVPLPTAQNQPVTAPPENGFVNRRVSGVHGSSGYAGNGGFDGHGMFHGNGGAGDGVLHTGGGADSKGQPLGPGETVQAKQIYDYLTEKYQLSPVIASGILGNMQTESSFRTNSYNRAEGAIGLCNWENGKGPNSDRRTQLENFAAAEHKPVTDWHVQVDFMMKEFHGSESRAFAKLQLAETSGQAAAIVDKYYERSSGAARGERMANAENIHRHLAKA